MGNSSSNVFKEFNVYLLRNIKRKTRKFNAVPRAEKLLELEKRTRAPLHDSTKKIVEKLIKGFHLFYCILLITVIFILSLTFRTPGEITGGGPER